MKKTYIAFVLGMIAFQASWGQNLTIEWVQDPCNNDGILMVTAPSTLPLPLSFEYNTSNGLIQHFAVNSYSDILDQVPLLSSNYIAISVQSSGGSLTGNTISVQPFYFTVGMTQPICPSTNGIVSATEITGNTDTFSYEWTNFSTGLVYTGNNSPLPLGSYQGIITDDITGCQMLMTNINLSVFQNSPITAQMTSTPASCNNGTASIASIAGGIAPYTFAWNTGATTQTITDLLGGTYIAVVTDAQGCFVDSLEVEVVQNPTIEVFTTITDANCQASDGAVTAFASGGVNPYTYQWSNGQTGSNLTNVPGQQTYHVMATDANGCIGSAEAFVGIDTPIDVTYNSTPSDCTAPTGTVTLTPTGGATPYSVIWGPAPGLSGLTLNNVSNGTYHFVVSDANGCVRTGSVVVQQIGTAFINIVGGQVICPATTGTLTLNVDGSNPPFTYLWNNGVTTNSIQNMPLSSYTCTITDNIGCTWEISQSLYSVSPINLDLTTTGVSCLYNQDGTATTLPSGGTPPYSYYYSNGQTTQTATGLNVGENYVEVTDGVGCSESASFVIQNDNTVQDCYCTLSGIVFADDNGNCQQDPGENGIHNVMIHCSNHGYTFSDNTGYYSFQVPSGTYTLSEQINAYYPLASCQSNDIVVSVTASDGCVNTNNFAQSINPLHDLKLTTQNKNLPPRHGFEYLQSMVIYNQGTLSESLGILNYTKDPQIIYNSSTLPSLALFDPANYPNWFKTNPGDLVLEPGDEMEILLSYTTPEYVPLNTELDYLDSIAHAGPIADNWLLDYSPWNNVCHFETTVVGAYDPNYKEVSPRGYREVGYVPMSTMEFDYTIHFQNEGTYFAQNIVVTDQLDSDFDWTTFVPGYSEYPYTAEISETGKLKLTFADINLPWKSQYGDLLSSASVHYSIKRYPDAPVGTELTNTANIYFDFNPAIITNTTLNTLTDLVGVTEEQGGPEGNSSLSLGMYPNPASDLITVQVNSELPSQYATYTVMDVTGKVVMQDHLFIGNGKSVWMKDISTLPVGIYVTQLSLGSGETEVKRLVVGGR